MSKTKEELQWMVLRQQEKINAQDTLLKLQSKQIDLLKEQTQLLWDYNFKFCRPVPESKRQPRKKGNDA